MSPYMLSSLNPEQENLICDSDEVAHVLTVTERNRQRELLLELHLEQMETK